MPAAGHGDCRQRWAVWQEEGVGFEQRIGLKLLSAVEHETEAKDAELPSARVERSISMASFGRRGREGRSVREMIRLVATTNTAKKNLELEAERKVGCNV